LVALLLILIALGAPPSWDLQDPRGHHTLLPSIISIKIQRSAIGLSARAHAASQSPDAEERGASIPFQMSGATSHFKLLEEIVVTRQRLRYGGSINARKAA